MLQQYLPFTVLKLYKGSSVTIECYKVATVLTVYGIETYCCQKQEQIGHRLQQYLPFTVLKPSTATAH